MKVVFRADASLQMGSGHVMRCLTLADALKAQGAQCQFISRAHPGHLIDIVRQRGYMVNSLVASVNKAQAAIKNENIQPEESTEVLAHTAWLGCDWQADAAQTADILEPLHPDWLVLDHYALDHRWESALLRHYKKLMVIDDLADRAHNCDLLLDQNLGRQPQDYAGLVPTSCQVLTGPHYALLRPEFAALREYSLKRRANSQDKQIKQLLITMGGVDQSNATGRVLQALKGCALSANCRVTVVMGLTAPWLQNVQQLAAQMPWPTDVMVNINDMAHRMADSDLAIGAAGSTSWERCCLGLPALMVVLANNQKEAAEHLQKSGAANFLAFSDLADQDLHDLLQCFIDRPEKLSQMSACASAITDGLGVERMVAAMENSLSPNI